MLRLAVSIVLEAVLGLILAGVVLAIAVPLMVRHQVITPGDTGSAALIAGVLLCAIGGVLFRPGSALNRLGKG